MLTLEPGVSGNTQDLFAILKAALQLLLPFRLHTLEERTRLDALFSVAPLYSLSGTIPHLQSL